MSNKKSDATALVLLSFLLLIVLLGGVVNPTFAASSAAQKTMVWRMAHYQPEQRPLMQGIKWWANELEKRTGGRIKIKHYFAQELARAKEIISMVGTGGVELGTPAVAYHPSEFPLMKLISDYPYEDLDELFWLAPRVVEQVPALQAEWEKINVKPLSYGGLSPYGIVSAKPTKKLGDLKGYRIRVFGSVVPLKVAALGMVPLTLPSSEIYEAMAKGAVECSFSTLDQHKIGLWEVAKSHLKGDFQPTIYAAQPIMNLKLFNSLDPELRKIIINLQVDHFKVLKKILVEGNISNEKFLKSKGVFFSTLSEAENKRLKQISKDAWEKAATKVKNRDGLKAVRAALIRLKAEYSKIKNR